MKTATNPVTALAELFCTQLGTVTFSQLQEIGINVAEALANGQLKRSPGRFVTGFLPGDAVVAEMWNINPHLCSLLNHQRPKAAC